MSWWFLLTVSSCALLADDVPGGVPSPLPLRRRLRRRRKPPRFRCHLGCIVLKWRRYRCQQDPALSAIRSEAEFDSYLTLGITDGSAPGAMAASPGLGLEAWTEDAGFSTSNGALFYMCVLPDDKPLMRSLTAPLT